MAYATCAGARVSSDNFQTYRDFWAIGTEHDVALTALSPGTDYRALGLYQVGPTIYVERGEGYPFRTLNDDFCHFENRTGSAVTLTLTSTLTTPPDMEYSYDKSTWITMGFEGTESVVIQPGARAYLRGDNSSLCEDSSFMKTLNIQSNGELWGGGNIMTLLDRTGAQTAIPDYGFSYLFKLFTALKSAPSFATVTSVGECGCYGMFENCESLLAAPELPATTLTHACYALMFSTCSAMETAPRILPATTLAQSCYSGMFMGCISMTTAPELPATTMAMACCMDMFYGCSALTVAPELPATVLATSCYERMFKNCTGLTKSPMLAAGIGAPDGGNMYAEMFYGCSGLLAAYIGGPTFDMWDGAMNHRDWLYGVANKGILYAPAGMTIPYPSTSGCPGGWEIEYY